MPFNPPHGNVFLRCLPTGGGGKICNTVNQNCALNGLKSCGIVIVTLPDRISGPKMIECNLSHSFAAS